MRGEVQSGGEKDDEEERSKERRQEGQIKGRRTEMRQEVLGGEEKGK